MQVVALQPRDSAASQLLANLLTKIRLQRSSFMRLRVARKGDPAEAAFFNLLVEDRSTAGMSYVEYLCQVRRRARGPERPCRWGERRQGGRRGLGRRSPGGGAGRWP